CSGPRCTNFSRCFFYKARQSMEAADIIVTNHDLVLSDLALGGGVILPEPEKTIYIFDEAHHLPIKSTNHFASFARIRGSIASLEQCTRVMRQLENSAALGSAEHPRRLCRDLADSTAPVIESLNELWLLLQDFVEPADSRDEFDRGVHCFPLGVVPAGVQQSAAVLSEQFSQLSTRLDQLNSLLKDNMEDGESILARQEAEQWYAAVGSLCGRIDKALGLWRSFAHTDPAGEAPTARWLKPVAVGTSEDISLSASPVLAARNLQENLWERCAGAVLTSATLSALGNFDLLNMRAGLPSGTRYFRIPSPFDYQQAAALVIPKLNCLPGDPRHTEVITLAIPQILDRQSAALMLFSSRRQMLDVLSGLTAEWRELVLCQDDYQKTQLLAYHRQRIDRGEGSVIFGLASFAEGVDLPGKYCTHVLIAKIPFAVPDDPIEATLADWLTSQSKNPFMTLSVPEAALRLVQSSGRLLRSETDTGLITLFDERIVSKFYGRSILESLPPYRREVFRQQYDLPEAVRSMN
ncbi:MAG: helicase C-terminal domain-containing protein, partial [Pseudohongiellaceae bacterium]